MFRGGGGGGGSKHCLGGTRGTRLDDCVWQGGNGSLSLRPKLCSAAHAVIIVMALWLAMVSVNVIYKH